MSKKNSWWLFMLALIITTTILFYKRPLPPLAEMANARKCISQARQKNSGKYAQATLMKAEILYDSALSQWSIENKRFSLFRDFEKSRLFATQACQMAQASQRETSVLESELKSAITDRIGSLHKRFSQYNDLYGNIPLSLTLREALTQARIYLQEGLFAFKNKDFLTSMQKLDSSELRISRVTTNSRAILENYLKDHQKWSKWVKESIKESERKNLTCLIVDKYERSCKLYKNGKLKDTYLVELGPNWIGDKKQQGDQTTPEGIYSVTKKKSGSQTQYFKALLINYPNEDDKVRFHSDKKNGKLNYNVNIGGLIEIHGHGGKGIDWTNGCIALTNQDMEKVFNESTEGTIVTIVGSLRSFKQILAG